ncbi:MAG: hypothetical protein H8E25_13735 [Planctomycetes bacterium]|nr:hypothetical protein [Planctomycetota bacterium]
MKKIIPFVLCTLVATSAFSFGQQDGGLGFEGDVSLSYPHLGNYNLIDDTATIEAWVKIDSDIDFHGVDRVTIWNHLYSGYEHTGLFIQDNGSVDFLFHPSPGGNNLTAPSVFPFDDLWHHLAITRTATGMTTIYVDGTEVFSQDYASSVNTSRNKP